MHTAICSFDDKATAERALDRLVQSGFARHDLHIEHKHVTSEGRRDANDRWDGMEREVAVDRSVLKSYGAFFASLLGEDDPSGHVDTYTDRVERGGYVVVVDAHDEGEALQAQAVMRDMQGGHMNVVRREGRRPLREIVGTRGQPAGMAERDHEPYESTGTRTMENDRAMASGNMTEQHTLGTRHDPDLMHAPGLRYADKDKPNG